jgi:glycine/D-amino acid oxidase-like deaminating enzyme/nitrite reductase/ring-hydroxylating ferredoxin subunit
MESEGAGSAAELDRDLTCDVAIVGAGIAGLSTAYNLAREGLPVVVLDDGPPAGGETCRTTAHLTFSQDDGNAEVEKVHGLDGLRVALESHAAAIDFIERTVRGEGIECGFERVDGYLFVSPNGQGQDFLDRERAACHRAGYGDCHFAERAPLPFETGRVLVFPRHGRFHPLDYLRGLAGAISRAGGLIFSGTHVNTITDGKESRLLTASGKTVTARRGVVVATNAPVNDWVALHTKQAAYRTYAIACPVPDGSIAAGLYWDTEDPYHYVRTQKVGGREMLISGGEDHKTGQANDAAERWDRLEKWTRERFPMAGAIAYRWSGQTLNPVDYMAFIGKNPGNENVYVVTGDSGMGMTHGTIAGKLLTDLIQGRSNQWAALYDPSRKPKSWPALKEFATENANVVARFADLVTGGDVSSAEEIRPDCGAVLRRGIHKVAAYRDADGRVHECSAICPHLGCVVHWNDGEKTWDCPCHGSRFDARGKVVNGPANGDLKPAG